MSGKCKIYWGLWPFSVLYGIGVRVRNLLFDVGWLHEERFPLPVICIGNLTVGGTGKTPHTEYLIRLLQNSFRLAVLSRGYKRKTSGNLKVSCWPLLPPGWKTSVTSLTRWPASFPPFT